MLDMVSIWIDDALGTARRMGRKVNESKIKNVKGKQCNNRKYGNEEKRRLN